MTKVEIIKPSVREITYRITEHLERAGSPAERERIALTWSGYVGSLLEWGALEVAEHRQLMRLLKPYLPDEAPIYRIFRGFGEDAAEESGRASPARAPASSGACSASTPASSRSLSASRR